MGICAVTSEVSYIACCLLLISSAVTDVSCVDSIQLMCSSCNLLSVLKEGCFFVYAAFVVFILIAMTANCSRHSNHLVFASFACRSGAELH